jgi:hypothetical protein
MVIWLMVEPPILYHPVIRQVLFPSIVEDPLETIVFSIGSIHELGSLDIVGLFTGDWIATHIPIVESPLLMVKFQ